MTHQLLINFDNNHTQTTVGNIPTAYRLLLRDVLAAIIERHGAELWGNNQIMRGPVDLLRGSDEITLEAKTRKLSTRIEMEEMDAAKYDRNGVIDAVVENIVTEIRAELDGYAKRGEPINFYPYVFPISSGLIIDPLTMNPVISLMIRYATMPVKAAAKVSPPEDEDQAVTIAIT